MKAQFRNVYFICEGCGFLLFLNESRKEISCTDPKCKFYKIKFQVPTITLVEKDKGGEE